MNQYLKAVILLIVIVLSVATLSEAIKSIGSVPTIFPIGSNKPGEGGTGTGVKSREESVRFSPSTIFPKFREALENSSEVDIVIRGITNTSYVRCVVFDEYLAGSWRLMESNPQAYDGETIAYQVPNLSIRENRTVEIEALKPLTGFIPIFLGTRHVDLTKPLSYYSDAAVFSTSETISGAYTVQFTNKWYKEDILNASKTQTGSDDLQVDEKLIDKIKPLAELVVGNAITPYQKITRLVSYLKTNYRYNLNYTEPTLGADPVEYFLYTSKEGICLHFNSALVLMLRSINIPARLVGGYLIDPTVPEQQVTPGQRHAYSEVHFENLGWITFDATASPACKDCEAAKKSGAKIQNDTVKTTSTPIDPSKRKNNINNSTKILAQCGKCPNVDLFEIYGQTLTPYLRTNVGELYQNGVWDITQPTPEPYTKPITYNVGHFTEATINRFTISPLLDMGGFIPTAIYTSEVSLTPLTIYPGHMLFYTKQISMNKYSLTHTIYTFNENYLKQAKTVKEDKLLTVPEELSTKLQPLAESITRQNKSEYEKLKALELYLKTNYKYDANYTRAPTNVDPVDWFLFQEKRGVCSNFNSAFVLLARSIGIPARLVAGYSVNPQSDFQVVNGKQAHAYSEVQFEGVGWITFDATGGKTEASSESSGEITPKKPQPTFTEITKQDPYCVRGVQFEVGGTVEDDLGNPVSGLKILIYIKEAKTDSGLLIGEGQINFGAFKVACNLPRNIENGNYLIQTHTIGNSVYNSSWSDPPIRVMSKAKVELTMPSKVINGESFDYIGNLTDYLTNEPLSNQICYLNTPNGVLTLKTDENGLLKVKQSGLTKGTYIYTLSWPGTRDYIPSNISATVKSLPLTLSPSEPGDLIRLEEARLVGQIHAEELTAEGRTVKIYLDQTRIGEAKSDSYGMFMCSYLIPATREIGPAQLLYSVDSPQYPVESAEQSVTIYAKTTLEAKSPSAINLKQSYNVSLTLVDDLKNPLKNSNLTLRYRLDEKQFDLSDLSNDEGASNFTLRVDEAPKNTTLKFDSSFAGRDYYLPSTTSFQQTIMIPPDMTMTYILIAGITSTLGIGGYLSWRRMKNKTQRSEPHPAEETPSMPSVADMGLTLEFPQIKPPLPAVWGISEPIEIKVTPTDLSPAQPKISLSADNITIEDTRVTQGLTYASIKFNSLGLHKISATGGNSTVSLQLKIVNYREEITTLYNDFHIDQRSKDQLIEEDWTARELQSHLAGKSPTGDYNLESLTEIFEVADYSLHDVTRRDYERFYLAKRGWEMSQGG